MPRRRLNPNDSAVSADNLPVFYKYRFTYADNYDRNQQVSLANSIAAEIRALYCNHDNRLVMGIEHYTKGMVSAKPHVHIHFVSKHASDTIRHHLRTKFEMVGRVQVCKAEVLVDEDKFWRYPLKQQKGETKVYYRTFGFEEREQNMIDVAYACWKQSAEVAIRQEEARQERSSKERLWAYLDTQEYVDIRDSYIKAYEYYAHHEMQFNPQMVRGYVLMYLMKNGIVSAAYLVDSGV